jgi:chromosome partitioning protein
VGRIISIANQKGGVGKTTTTINLGATLAELGKKVLLIDIDPQGNGTSGIGIDKSDIHGSIYDVLINEVGAREVIIPTQSKNLDIIPANVDLAGAELELNTAISREFRLKNALEEVKEDYDYLLVDCPPALGLLTINAFTASDSILIPVQAEYLALEGLTQLLKNIELVRNHFNPELKVEGVLITMYDSRTKLSEEVAEDVRKYFREKVYETQISRNVALAEAPSSGQSIIEYDSASKGAMNYRLLAKEVVAHG